MQANNKNVSGNSNASIPANDICAKIKRVAYFSMDQAAGQSLSLLQIDGRLCSHLILAFARIDSHGVIRLMYRQDERYLREVHEFKRRHPGIKVLISVCNNHAANTNSSSMNDGSRGSSSSSNASPTGDIQSATIQHYQTIPNSNQSNNTNNEGQQQPANSHQAAASSGFTGLVQNVQNRQKFPRSVIEFLNKFNLDGIDLDWEFPNFPHTFNSREYERTGLTKIVKELRSAIVENFFNRQVTEQQHQFADKSLGQLHSHSIYHVDGISNHINQVEPYLLTIAIGAQDAILRSSYELKLLANLCDWFNVMSYDYYLFKPYAPFTGPNCPLYPIIEPYVPYLGKLSFTSTINRLLSEDIEVNKIVMGIPTYARAYRLLFRSQHPAVFTIAYSSKGGQISQASSSKVSQNSPTTTNTDCYLTNREITEILALKDTKIAFDEKARVPYLLTDDGYTWISYEDERSVREKLACILEHNLAGYMTWNLNCDCIENDRFPLHEALRTKLDSMSNDSNLVLK